MRAGGLQRRVGEGQTAGGDAAEVGGGARGGGGGGGRDGGPPVEGWWVEGAISRWAVARLSARAAAAAARMRANGVMLAAIEAAASSSDWARWRTTSETVQPSAADGRDHWAGVRVARTASSCSYSASTSSKISVGIRQRYRTGFGPGLRSPDRHIAAVEPPGP